MVLYDECCTSSFKKEKTVSDFANASESAAVAVVMLLTVSIVC